MNAFSVFLQTQSWLKKNNIEFSAYDSTTSTNDLAKTAALSFNTAASVPQHVYLADQQTRGRGRGQNTWLNSTPGSALLITWSFLLTESPQNLTGPLFGLAVYRALEESFAGTPFSIKAPNDIYLKSKKILGILVETVKQGRRYGLVVGLGLNVFSNPKEIENSECLNHHTAVNEKNWSVFLTKLNQYLKDAGQAATETSLCDQDREDLLTGLNRFEGLKTPYKAVSPFGDLSNDSGVVSWRQL